MLAAFSNGAKPIVLRQQASAVFSAALGRYRRLWRIQYLPFVLDHHRSAIYCGLSLLQQFDRQTQPLVGVEHRPQRVGEVRQIGIEVQRLVQRLGDGVETAR